MIDAIQSTKDKLGKSETWWGLELQGYTEDLKLLNKKVTFYESYTNKLKQLVEEDAKKMLKKLQAENDRLKEGKKWK